MNGSMRQRGIAWESGVSLGADPFNGKQCYAMKTVRAGRDPAHLRDPSRSTRSCSRPTVKRYRSWVDSAQRRKPVSSHQTGDRHHQAPPESHGRNLATRDTLIVRCSRDPEHDRRLSDRHRQALVSEPPTGVPNRGSYLNMTLD